MEKIEEKIEITRSEASQIVNFGLEMKHLLKRCNSEPRFTYIQAESFVEHFEFIKELSKRAKLFDAR